MLITKVYIPCFKDIIVEGLVSQVDKDRINEIRKTMTPGGYGGYSPEYQKKRKKIVSILTKYNQPTIAKL